MGNLCACKYNKSDLESSNLVPNDSNQISPSISNYQTTSDTSHTATTYQSYSTSENTEVDQKTLAELHLSCGGSPEGHSSPEDLGKSPNSTIRIKKPYSGPYANKEDACVSGLEQSAGQDSGVHSKLDSLASPVRGRTRSHTNQKVYIQTEKGKTLLTAIKKSYKLKDKYSSPMKEFLKEMDKLFMDAQIYLTDLSSRETQDGRNEADAIVEELVALRNHWGTKLLPAKVCNAFVRERIYLTSNQRRFRIDCAQFFEPVPFYSTTTQNPGELMKLYRFSVYDMSRNEVVMRYYLERSNVVQLYHVLCFSQGTQRGQVCPYGTECPPYWDIRKQMINDVCIKLHTS